MVTVSLSVYQDSHLADGALQSIRDVLGDVPIQVVDGRYSTFRPDAPDNSTDDIKAVANRYGATYHSEGPFDLERDKHVRRVELAPDGELCLFIDADERIYEWNGDGLPEGKAIGPRIANLVVYGTHAVYWPRIFKPEWVKTVNSWDAFLFNVPHERSDAVTILHRHDLRDKSYRQEKYKRFDREDRVGRYESDFETYLNDEWDMDFEECPECGEMSMVRTQVTDMGPEMTQVAACVNGDGCYATIEPVTVGEYRYVPDRLDAGFEEDPARLRIELLDAGCSFVRAASVGRMVRDMEPAIRLWVEHHYEDGESEVFTHGDVINHRWTD